MEHQLPAGFDIHFHLKRSYEMLADLRVSKSPRLHRRDTSVMSEVKPKREEPQISATALNKQPARTPWRITNVNTHNKLPLMISTPHALTTETKRERRSFPGPWLPLCCLPRPERGG
eukprot:746332-Hanusia_phi.AAC.14